MSTSIMTHPRTIKYNSVGANADHWLDLRGEGGTTEVQICLNDLPPEQREALIALVRGW